MSDLTVLDKFKTSRLLTGGDPAPGIGGIPSAPLERFHEDSENARKEFDRERLQELADSMSQVNASTGKQRGILEPLLVKSHPEKPDDFIICGGNRRYRAAIIAGLSEVPYILNGDLDDFDKFVLNAQREALNPLEIATFIKERLKEGHKAGEIAKKLGKSPSFISDHSTFFKFPDCIRVLYDNGRCRSMQALALLYRAYKKHPQMVADFCKVGNQELLKSHAREFVEGLKKADKKTPTVEKRNNPIASTLDTQTAKNPQLPIESELTANTVVEGENLTFTNLHSDDAETGIAKKVVVMVEHEEQPAALLTNRIPRHGQAWIQYENGQVSEVELQMVKLVAVVEA